MAEQGKTKIGKKEEKKAEKEAKIEESLVRILSTDIPGSKNVYTGLTRIKGVSWSFSNAICTALNIDKNRKIFSLNEEEIKKISEFVKNPNLPEFLLNRRKDVESGKSFHLIGSNLDLQKEFDIRKLKKIRSYKGLRHALGQPVRGQRTRSHFRARGKKGKKKTIGVMNKPKPGKK